MANGVTRLAAAEATVKKGRPTGDEIFKEIEKAAADGDKITYDAKSIKKKK